MRPCEFGCGQSNLLKHAGHVLKNIGIPKSKDGYVSCDEPSVALTIVLKVRSKIVLSAIELDRQAQSRAIEIEYVGSRGMLTAELVAIDLSIAQPIPQPTFHEGGVLSKSSCPFRFSERSIESRHNDVLAGGPRLSHLTSFLRGPVGTIRRRP